MNIISTIVLPLITVAVTLIQCPMRDEHRPVSVKDLRNVATEVVLEGRLLTLSTYPWRDFMPGTLSGPDGSPMMVALKVATTDKKPFPSGVRMERAWIAFGEQVRETSKLRDPLNSPPNEKDSWIKCSDTPVCETTARNGPKWGPGVFVDVVVRLIDKEGRHYLLRAPKQYVQRTD